MFKVPQFFIGVDPGSYKAGVGVIDGESNYLLSTVLKPRLAAESAHKRLRDLGVQLLDVFSKYPAGLTVICVERPFLRTGVEKTALIVAGAYWMAVSAADAYGIPIIYTPSPNETKKLAGRGDYDKDQMIKAALQYWRLEPGALKYSDEADALWGAVYALTSWRSGMVPQLDAKVARPRKANPQLIRTAEGTLAQVGTIARRKGGGKRKKAAPPFVTIGSIPTNGKA